MRMFNIVRKELEYWEDVRSNTKNKLLIRVASENILRLKIKQYKFNNLQKRLSDNEQ